MHRRILGHGGPPGPAPAGGCGTCPGPMAFTRSLRERHLLRRGYAKLTAPGDLLRTAGQTPSGAATTARSGSGRSVGSKLRQWPVTVEEPSSCWCSSRWRAARLGGPSALPGRE
ncbi:MAG: hypothetical protein WKG07_24175 [Hymenobacter sp.]